MEWNFKSGQPIYTQIIDQLKVKIAIGEFKPGEKIPSVRELAMEASVNPNTMQRALSEIEREGLVYTVRAKGRFVTDEPEKLQYLKSNLAKEHVKKLFSKLEELGIEKKEIVDIVIKWSEEEQI